MKSRTLSEIRTDGKTVAARISESLSLACSLGGKAQLNCVAETDPTALWQAEELEKSGKHALPLYGIPVLVKDNIDVKGLHTTAGSLALQDNLAKADAPIVQNLRKNGAIVIGKTNMTEFANYTTKGMPGGYSSRGGQVIHAIDPALSPSGSSSGSAVAVAAGIVPVAVGTDTSFSIIACAQENGICGLKPPVGALSSQGIIPIARTLDSAGAMANCFQDALALYSAMRDTPLSSIGQADRSKLKIAVNIAGIEQVSPGQGAFLNAAADALKASGARIEEVNQPYTPYQSVIMKWEFKAHLEDYLRSSSASRKTLAEITAYYEENPGTMLRYGDSLLKEALFETPGGLSGAPYLEALKKRSEAISAARKTVCEYDAVMMTGPTNIMHFCGFPSATVVGSALNDHGVKRGLILYGSDEVRLCRAALAIENQLQTLSLEGCESARSVLY